ncbi:MAG: putative FmdB family regulatory protein [Hydrogenophaga sp.]|jgi:putative FmdB family regulatory protein
MPIYAYKCTACGHAKDVLQKMSDALLTVCPACSQASFQKQLTAAGFQLKGSGWYVTDFRNGNTGGAPAAGKGEGQSEGEGKGTGEGASPVKPAEGASPAPATTPSAAAAPAAAPPAPSPSSSSSTS